MATLTDILRVIVLHVRDYRGDHSEVRVFTNLLVEEGDSLVVVARDPELHTKDYKREIPKRYRKAALVAGRAMEARSAISVGDIHLDYPEAPRNRPYRSILAIPLISSDDKSVFGALSVDSSRPYFFESFAPGVVENDLENTLAPYIHTLVMAVETLVARDPSTMVKMLVEAAGKSEATPRAGGNAT